ncbi:hypothetical protein FGADI_12298 [Fusarium gaditjirri]|uniref:Uncharacterized protein n=1 Tax=Fusarium gaditjirri TaxID=282569 RepID=A0A8H4ST15_9HYPO|nr:hypothetical protein FGADI_12298 [Fusarium gaditjirri]
MAFWIDSNPPSEIFKEKDDQWRDDGSAKVIQPGTGLSQGISDWLRGQNDGSPSTMIAHFMIIPQDEHKYAATYQQMDTLSRIWMIPSPVFGFVCDNPPAALCPSAIITGADGTPWMCLALKPEPAKDLACHFGPRMPFSHDITIVFPLVKEAAQSTYMERQSNCLVFCPRRYFEKIETAVSSPHLLPVGEPQMRFWQLLILIIAEMDNGWRVFFAITLMDSQNAQHSLRKSQASLISADSLVVLDHLISRIADVTVDIRHIIDAIQSINKVLSNIVNQRSQEIIGFKRLLDATRLYKTRFCSFLRRLDEQNSLEAEKLQVLTRKSAQDARDMKRLATLTMIFLPSTVVAAFFSTPFMSLDEGLNFKALSKVWILFLTSSIVTLLTFGVSWTWDAMARWRQSNNQEENESLQSKVYNTDKGVLEPEPGQFTTSDLLDDILKAWNSSEASSENGDGGSSTIQTRDEEESSLET